MKRFIGDIEIDLQGHDVNRFIVDGSGQDLFIAIGCSWTRAWGAHDECLDFKDPDFEDDMSFINHQSFPGLVCSYLNIDAKLIMAIPGSNNDMQSRLLIEFLQKNRDKFRRIFVL